MIAVSWSSVSGYIVPDPIRLLAPRSLALAPGGFRLIRPRPFYFVINACA